MYKNNFDLPSQTSAGNLDKEPYRNETDRASQHSEESKQVDSKAGNSYKKFFIQFFFSLVLVCIAYESFAPASPIGGMTTKGGAVLSVYATYIATFIFIYLPVLLIFMFAARLSSKRHHPFPTILSRALIPALVLCALFVFGASQASAEEQPPIFTSVVLQPSKGLTEKDFTMQMLEGIEEWSRVQMLENSKQAFVQQGFSADQFKGYATAESGYLTMQDKRLGVIKVCAGYEGEQVLVKMVRIFGFVDDGIAIVGCTRQSDQKIPLTFGVCGEKIKEVFTFE